MPPNDCVNVTVHVAVVTAGGGLAMLLNRNQLQQVIDALRGPHPVFQPTDWDSLADRFETLMEMLPDDAA